MGGHVDALRVIDREPQVVQRSDGDPLRRPVVKGRWGGGRAQYSSDGGAGSAAQKCFDKDRFYLPSGPLPRAQKLRAPERVYAGVFTVSGYRVGLLMRFELSVAGCETE